ncbi:MAG: hypothetical protein H6766_06370 [Candidatus Peribacteria bacterium]|nr:MAG: hypothetical protein H6766_06370 [Candidatus Peribacteria bacterium]
MLGGQFVSTDEVRNFESLDTRSREIRHKTSSRSQQASITPLTQGGQGE